MTGLVDDLRFLPTTIVQLTLPLPSPTTLAGFINDNQYKELRYIHLMVGAHEDATLWNPFALAGLRAAFRHRGLRLDCDGTTI